MKILLVEDDIEMVAHVAQGLEDEGHQVTCAGDGPMALQLGTDVSWDLMVVDRMLPGLDGLSVVRMLRANQVVTPVLFLTTMSGIDDRVAGLNAGGDDYLIKPFAFPELAARVNALGRRPQKMGPETLLRLADLEMDLLGRTVRRGDQPIDLQPREFQLLEYLLRHADQVVTRTMLLENVWDFHFDPQTNLVESHISRLRGKIHQLGHPELIHTVRGAGYCARLAI